MQAYFNNFTAVETQSESDSESELDLVPVPVPSQAPFLTSVLVPKPEKLAFKKPEITRLARRAGIPSLNDNAKIEAISFAEAVTKTILRKAAIITECDKRKYITKGDLRRAYRILGSTYYGTIESNKS